MHPLKSIFILILLSLAANTYSADSFEFDPQNYEAKIKTNHIWFIGKTSNEKIGPELYADETDPEFFALVKNIITNSETDNTKIILFFKNINSENHGSYNKIIPDF